MRRVAALALVLPLLALAGCGPAHSTGPTTPATTPGTGRTTSAADPTASAAAPPALTSQAPASSRPARPSPSALPTTARPGSGAPGYPAPACRTAGLQIDVLRGSGISGRQFASVSFTNTGTRPCAMSGVPWVELVRAGQPLDRPAQATAKSAPLVVLAPGAAAATMLVGFSTCDAPNSDAARIAPPGQAGTVDVPLVLRGCRLEVDPVSPAA